MMDMIGIGPFVVSPLVIRAMGGPQSLSLGLRAPCLRSSMVSSGQSSEPPFRAPAELRFLREAYGPGKWGRLIPSFGVANFHSGPVGNRFGRHWIPP